MDAATKKMILEDLGGLDEAIYDELVADCIAQSGGEFEELKTAAAIPDHARLDALGHSIKGSAGNLRLTELQTAAKAVEFAGKEKRSAAEIVPLMAELEKALRSLGYGGTA
ncbi:MAG: Hpt domain-containing protein [Candidatus Omnitrophica bacterium]|nr:Hpt domain-containing protein [Candidatus Omnitrophota bacterium]